MFTIPKIEGNSKIGSSVYSNIGKKQNAHYHMFMPTYEESKELEARNKQESELVQQLNMYRGF